MVRMDKKHIPVSIVIPAYNEERQLGDCLRAIERQTMAPYEVIVVDNNSTDKTAEIAHSFPFVTVVKAQKQGIVFARNAGFDVATGDVIGRIDADITMPSTWVAHISEFYEQPKNQNSVWSGRGYFYNMRFAALVSWGYSLLAFYLNWLLLGHFTLWGSNMAMRRDHWRKVRSNVHNRTDIHEDLDLAMHMHDAGYKIVYDRQLETHAALRRVTTERDKLWGYLQWWPRTLRLHGRITWVVAWFFGAFLLYIATYFLVFVDWAARKAGRKPLPQR